MLYDRFDDMRSKQIGGGGGGEYDYDLTRLGTRVSVTASGSISKGGKWKGSINPQGSKTFNFVNLGSNVITEQTSIDCKVALMTLQIQANTTSLPIKFLSNGTYVEYNVDITSAVTELGLDSSITYWTINQLNAEGTLAYYFVRQNSSGQGNTKILILEIDKENMTASAYVSTFEESHQTSGNLILIDDKLLRANSSNNISMYKYNFEQHQFILKSTDNTGKSTLMYNSTTTNQPLSIAKANDNTYLISFDYSSSNGNKIMKLVFSATNFSFTSVSLTHTNLSNPRVYYSRNGMYVIGINESSPYAMVLFGLNINDLSYTALATYSFGSGTQIQKPRNRYGR